jgi:hypothetical protein
MDWPWAGPNARRQFVHDLWLHSGGCLVWFGSEVVARTGLGFRSAAIGVTTVRTNHLGILFLHLMEEGGKRLAAPVTKKFYRVVARILVHIVVHILYPLLA